MYVSLAFPSFSLQAPAVELLAVADGVGGIAHVENTTGEQRAHDIETYSHGSLRTDCLEKALDLVKKCVPSLTSEQWTNLTIRQIYAIVGAATCDVPMLSAAVGMDASELSRRTAAATARAAADAAARASAEATAKASALAKAKAEADKAARAAADAGQAASRAAAQATAESDVAAGR